MNDTAHAFTKRITIAALGIVAMLAPAVFGGNTLKVRPESPKAGNGAVWDVRAILVNETDKVSKRAAGTLQSHLLRLTGVKLPVNPKGMTVDANTENVILLGRGAAEAAGAMTVAELDALAWFGFAIRPHKTRVVVAGRTPDGTAYGVTGFLEQQGMEFFTRSVANVPKLDGVLTVRSEVDKPFFDGKRINGPTEIYGMSYDMFGRPRQFFTKLDGDKTVDRTAWLDHSAPFILPKKLYYDEHPEYYTLRGDGTRLPKDTTSVRSMICTTHPDVLKISVDRVMKWVDAQPERRFFTITNADDASWCRCETCRSMVYEGDNYSDVMLYWVNHVAREVGKKYPDKIFITLAYGPTQPAPVKIKPEPNVHVLYCAWPNKTSAPCGIRDFDAPANSLAHKEITDWLKMAPDNVGLYDYNGGPRYTVDGMAAKIKWSAKHGLRGFWYCGGNTTFKSLFGYVNARLNWDPNEDLADLKARFIKAFYGPAAEPMGNVINGIYDRLATGKYDNKMHGRPPAEFYTPEFTRMIIDNFDKAIAILEKAENKALDEVILDRQFFMENCVSRTAPAGRDATADEMGSFAIAIPHYVKRYLVEHEAQVKAFEAGGRRPKLSHKQLTGLIWKWTRVRIDHNDFKDGQLPARLVELCDAPLATIKKYQVTDMTETLADGWRLPAEAFVGGRYWDAYDWKCEPRQGVAVYGKMTEHTRTEGKITLPAGVEKSATTLELLGQDSDKLWCDAPPIEISINGQTLFNKISPFVKQGWSTLQISVPAGVLRQGKNTITLMNHAQTDHLTAAWTMISEARIVAGKE